MSVDCRWARVRIPAFVDGELVEPELSQLREHVAKCPDCGAAVRLEEALIARLRKGREQEKAPLGLLDRVRAGLDEAPAPASILPSSNEGPARRRRSIWSLLTVAAAAVLVLLALPWGAPASGLVTAMAAEHSRRVDGDQYREMSLVTDDNGEIEKYLTRELGVEVNIPRTNVPKKRGASCGASASGATGRSPYSWPAPRASTCGA
jgi:anti-sigma factor (TIGR02949 family)